MAKMTRLKKHLSFSALRQSLSKHFNSIKDPRVTGRCLHSLHDSLMSAFACMYFQDPSLAEFQRNREKRQGKNNLRTLFHVQSIPKDTQLRELIDMVESESLRPVFKDYFERLRRGRYLDAYQIFPNMVMCSIDGVYHHASNHVHCDACLTKHHRNGSVTYQHGVLQGAVMHPDKKQVIPVMPEPISNRKSNYNKQDCEMNAAKRFLHHLKKDHPRLNVMIVGDGLFSKAPMINEVLACGFHFLLVAKPNDHQYMMDWLAAFESLPTLTQTDSQGRTHTYTYQNKIPLNDQPDAPKVNYVHYTLTNKAGKVTYRNSWVTDIRIDHDNVVTLVRAGRCRWKIENECFNTLKNQGYYIKHNFGHGKKHLSHNLYLLTLIAFFYHQIFELTDPAYQHCRRVLVSKRHLWEVFRNCIRFFVMDSWEAVMLEIMGEEDMEIRAILKR